MLEKSAMSHAYEGEVYSTVSAVNQKFRGISCMCCVQPAVMAQLLFPLAQSSAMALCLSWAVCGPSGVS